MRRWIVVVVGLMLLLPAVPAAAADRTMCPMAALQVNFYDVDLASPHADDIDCLALLSVVEPGGAFLPKQLLTRWEMAQWLTGGAYWLQDLPANPPTTFQDTGSLGFEVRMEIEQMRMLGITQGVGGSQYDPYGAIPRWQMALFLTRFLTAVGSDLPNGSDQGFSDIGGLSLEAVTSINQLRQLGITQGTGPATFSPYASVTREQMASFVARALERAWVFFPDIFMDDCQEIVPDGETVAVPWCTGTGYDLPLAPFRVRSHVMLIEPIPGNLRDSLYDPNTHMELFINGVGYDENVRVVELPGVTYKFFDVLLSGSSYNTHIQADFYERGQISWVGEVDMTFDY